MATVKTSGSQAATPSTEHSLATVNDAGIYYLIVDINALAADEYVELVGNIKETSGGTARLAQKATWSWLSVEKKARLGPIICPVNCALEYTLKQLNGSSRTFPWAVHEA